MERYFIFLLLTWLTVFNLWKVIADDAEHVASREKGTVVSEKQSMNANENIISSNDENIQKHTDDIHKTDQTDRRLDDVDQTDERPPEVILDDIEDGFAPVEDIQDEKHENIEREGNIDKDVSSNSNNEKKDEQVSPEADDSQKPMEITVLKVVKDNVTGDRGSSFSEDVSADRDDESTVTDVKREAEKRISEKENKLKNEEIDFHKSDQFEEKTSAEALTNNKNEIIENSNKNRETLNPLDNGDKEKQSNINVNEELKDEKSDSSKDAAHLKLDESVKKQITDTEDISDKNEVKELPVEKEEDSTTRLEDGTTKQSIEQSNLNTKQDEVESSDRGEKSVDEVESSDRGEKSVDEVESRDRGQTSVDEEEEFPAPESVELKKDETVRPEGDDLYEEAIALLKQGKKDVRRAHKLLAAAAEKNHIAATEKIVYPLLLGDNIRRNKTRAIELFHRLAEKGNPVGQQGLGFIYGAGISSNSSQAKALIYTTFGALGGSTKAQMMLGYRYFSGIGVQPNCESALTHYKKVAKTVSAEAKSHGGNAVQRIRLYDELEQPGGTPGQIDEDLLQYYQFLADKGDVQAQVGLGQLYFQGGRGVDINYEKAFKYFNLAATAGSGNGLAYLGKMYVEGLHVTKDIKLAHQYFQKSADDNNPIGQAGLGMLYLKGEGVVKDYDKAMKYFSQAAEQGWVEGQLQLGNMYYDGLGVKKDFRQAVKYFTFASQSGHVLAFYNLASMHAIGAGVMRSCQTATELFKNVAERGKWSMMFMDAYDAYKAGDLETALLKYYLLAELGYEVAQSNVAYILDKGDIAMFNPNQTFARALLQWTRAANQGYTVARVKVGDYHYYGLGTNIDYETAALNYRLASDQQNNPQAMFNLGYMHEQGFGLKKDIHLAKRFYDMAAEASPDAQFPVYLALTKLTIHFSLEWLQKNYRMWEQVDVDALKLKVVQYLGPEWDIYVITALAGILAILLLFRRAMRQ